MTRHRRCVCVMSSAGVLLKIRLAFHVARARAKRILMNESRTRFQRAEFQAACY